MPDELQNHISESTLNEIAEMKQSIKAMHGLSAVQVDNLRKLAEKDNNKETNKLIKELTEELKKPCQIKNLKK